MPTISFDDWKNEINQIVQTKIGCNLDELPDMQYRIWFDNQNLTSTQVSFIIIGEYYKEFELNVNFAKELITNLIEN
tara:strand:+ start:1264 stop:1494 length:231 start_codon:yes stop_codon:yes gene_type:complete